MLLNELTPLISQVEQYLEVVQRSNKRYYEAKDEVTLATTSNPKNYEQISEAMYAVTNAVWDLEYHRKNLETSKKKLIDYISSI